MTLYPVCTVSDTHRAIERERGLFLILKKRWGSRLLEDVLAGAREEGTLVAGLGSILDTVSEDTEDTAHLYL